MTSCELTNSSVTRWYISVVFPDEIHYYNYSNVLTNDELYKYEFAGVELVECDMTAQCMPETVPKPRPTLRMYHTVINSLFLNQILEKKNQLHTFVLIICFAQAQRWNMSQKLSSSYLNPALIDKFNAVFFSFCITAY